MALSSWLLLLALSRATSPETAEASRVERRLFAMGTELSLSVEATERGAALRATEEAARALEAAEARLSTWRSDSELTRLNRTALGEPMPLTPDLARALAEARWCWAATAGAFDPTVGALAEVWGLRRGGRLPTRDELTRARAATGMDGLLLQGSYAVRLRPGLVLDAGGFGKGVGLGAAATALRSDPAVRRGSLDLGGQLVLLGEGVSWVVDVADPRDRRRPVLELLLTGGSVATSGNAERGVKLGPYGHSHILDPRSGTPASDFGSLTVLTENPVRADCLSTGLYVMGPEKALRWATEQPEVEVLVLERAGVALRARATSGLSGRLRTLVPELEIEIVSAGTPPPSENAQAGPRRCQRTEGEGPGMAKTLDPSPSTKRAGSHPRISTRSVHAASMSNQPVGGPCLPAQPGGHDRDADTSPGPDR